MFLSPRATFRDGVISDGSAYLTCFKKCQKRIRVWSGGFAGGNAIIRERPGPGVELLSKLSTWKVFAWKIRHVLKNRKQQKAAIENARWAGRVGTRPVWCRWDGNC
ncbi:hypothetical protein CUJ84_pRLN1000201 (plasmid) [Rhizobium leguminosarum]|uniref:Uncharacterized protein n=1 Tax=Rhizobium leguminosarum TaxID=384 RepID=A0A2K9ZBS1_RHILE|nr:hypothetical protein CUJ84_pRLN1000201 [Rhizobium leguminosarum]